MNKRAFSPIILILLCVLVVFFLILSIYLSAANQGYRNLDFFTFWLGSHLTAAGQNPYDQTAWVTGHTLNNSTWIENLFYVYPMITAVIFVPFGLLDVTLASILWLFLSFCAITAGILLLLSLWIISDWRPYLFPVLLGAFIYRPLFLNFFVGQVDGFIFFFIAFSLFLFTKAKKTSWAFFFIALTVIKPNIGGPLILLISLFLIIHKSWKHLFFLDGSALLLLLFPSIFAPHWINDYFHVLQQKSADQNLFPNLRGLAGLFSNGSETGTLVFWITLSIIMFLLLMIYYFKFLGKTNIDKAVILALMVSLLITPYLRAYDLIFTMIPIITISGAVAARGSNFLRTNLLFLAWPLAAFALLLLASTLQQDIWSVLLSLFAYGFFLWQIFKDFRRDQHALTNTPS